MENSLQKEGQGHELPTVNSTQNKPFKETKVSIRDQRRQTLQSSTNSFGLEETIQGQQIKLQIQ